MKKRTCEELIRAGLLKNLEKAVAEYLAVLKEKPDRFSKKKRL